VTEKTGFYGFYCTINCDMHGTDCDMGDTNPENLQKKSKNSAFFPQNFEANCMAVLYMGWRIIWQ